MAESQEKPTPKSPKLPPVGMARLVSMLIILATIILLGIVFLRVLSPFLLPMFLAGVVAVICQPMFRYFMSRTKEKRLWSAGFTTLSFVAIILIPLVTMITIGSLQLYSFVQMELATHKWTKTVAAAKEKIGFRELAIRLHRIAPQIEIDENATKEERDRLFDEAISQREEQLRDGLEQGLKGIIKQTFSSDTALSTIGMFQRVGSIIVSCLIFVISLYYFLADGNELLEASEELIPVNVQHLREILNEFAKVVRSVVLATMLAALAQGLTLSLMLFFLGFGNFFIYSIIAILCALIPFVGTTIIWIPCTIALAAQGNYTSAVVLAVWGAGVVGTMDNVIRAYILNSDAKLHPLLAFVAILGGLQVLGLWGVFIAPIIASCLHALIKIFNTELYEVSIDAKSKEDAEKDKAEENPVKEKSKQEEKSEQKPSKDADKKES